MIAAVAIESGIAPSALLAEPPEIFKALVFVLTERAKAAEEKAATVDPSGLAARMAGR